MTVLVTGFPGFIGTRLVARLLADDPQARVVALVEGRMAARANEVAARIGDGRVEVLAGDIAQPRLGLRAGRYDVLVGEVAHVHHLAAIYDLAVPEAIATRVNVEGTRRVVELCAAAPDLQRHHYVSTAFVAGLRHGVVCEADLDVGQSHKNHYEATKFAAEVVVRDSMPAVPTTIHRPAIVVGDSRTGATQKFDGPYYLLRMISLLHRLGRPTAQIGRHDSPFNVVPVDFVVDAIAHGVATPQTLGATLHLVDPDPLSSAALVELLSVAYAGRRPQGRIPHRLLERSLRRDAIRRLFAGTPSESVRYLNHAVRFDTTATEALLPPTCPHFHAYAGTIVDFFRRNERDPAFVPGGG
jgi:thioester reductase-like protein